MKAAVFTEHGSTDIIEVQEVDIPDFGPNEVLVKVKAFALNRLDVWTREGMPSLNLEFPHVGGSDFAGIISDIGDNVTEFDVGDRVGVNPGVSCRICSECLDGEPTQCDEFRLLGEHVWGGAAEYAVVPAINLIKLPEHVSFKDAAATSLTGLTTYRMISTKAKIRPGDLVLVTGAGGGIGTMAIQIASVLGGRVIATTSTKEKMETAKELGAEYVINYEENPEWSKEVWKYTDKNGVDMVIDSSGEAVFEDAVRSLTKGGKYVTCGATTGVKGKLNLALLFWKQLQILGSTMSTHSEFEEVMQLFFQGKISPVIDSTYNLSEMPAAHKRQESKGHNGKIVIVIDD